MLSDSDLQAIRERNAERLRLYNTYASGHVPPALDVAALLGEVDELRDRLAGHGDYRIGTYATPAWGGVVSRVEIEHLPCHTILDDETDAAEYDLVTVLKLVATHQCRAEEGNNDE